MKSEFSIILMFFYYSASLRTSASKYIFLNVDLPDTKWFVGQTTVNHQVSFKNPDSVLFRLSWF